MHSIVVWTLNFASIVRTSRILVVPPIFSSESTLLPISHPLSISVDLGRLAHHAQGVHGQLRNNVIVFPGGERGKEYNIWVLCYVLAVILRFS